MNEQYDPVVNKSKSFQDLNVWKKAHAWVLGIYRLTECFPKHELFGLTSQLRRAAVSVPANIAEGFKRKEQRTKPGFTTSRKVPSKNAVTI